MIEAGGEQRWGRPVVVHVLLADAEILDRYASALSLAGCGEALTALSRRVALGLSCISDLPVTVVVRMGPQPALAVVGRFEGAAEESLKGQVRNLRHACTYLRYVDYRQAQADCEQLGAQLLSCFGRAEVGRFGFTGIPRGGVIVLGLLAYVLGLERSQLQPPYSPDVPLVVVDDCALTGARLAAFLEGWKSHQVVFASLYSPPPLRAAIQAQEPAIIACISAHDLQDHAQDPVGEGDGGRDHCLAHLPGRRYWVGNPDHICFAWNEPDRFFWNPVRRQLEQGWRVLPPELCLKNRFQPETLPVPIQVQSRGKGPLGPSEDALFADIEGQIIVANTATGKTFRLADVAADVWRAIVEYGTVDEVVGCLLGRYQVDEARLRSDVANLLEELTCQGLLRDDASGALA